MQDAAMQSQNQMITRSLQECGHAVDVLLTVDQRSCASNNETLVRQLSHWHGETARDTWHITATSQATNVRAALNHFRAVAARYDALILTRYDLLLKQPIRTWPGYPSSHGTIAVGSKCGSESSFTWNCTSDIIFVVPRDLLWAFDEAVGAPPSKKAELF